MVLLAAGCGIAVPASTGAGTSTTRAEAPQPAASRGSRHGSARGPPAQPVQLAPGRRGPGGVRHRVHQLELAATWPATCACWPHRASARLTRPWSWPQGRRHGTTSCTRGGIANSGQVEGVAPCSGPGAAVGDRDPGAHHLDGQQRLPGAGPGLARDRGQGGRASAWPLGDQPLAAGELTARRPHGASGRSVRGHVQGDGGRRSRPPRRP